MKKLYLGNGWLLTLVMAGFAMICGCDSGEKALDEITGNRAVQQYHRSKKNVERATDVQSERLKKIPDDDKEHGK